MGNVNSMISIICGGMRGKGTSVGNFSSVGDTKVYIGTSNVIVFEL